MPADPAARLHGDQIQGRRKRQEDAWCALSLDDGGSLVAVADGLGGHPAGDRASREALEVFEREFLRRRSGTGTPGDWLRDSLLAVHRHLLQAQDDDRSLIGMATTLIAVYCRDGRLSLVSVGDSYLLVLRAGRLIRVNTLHTEDGAITSCVGFSLTQMDMANDLALEPGDRLLLATDGIAVLDPDRLAQILAGAVDAQQAVEAVLDGVQTIDHPAQDNATVVALFT
jgi:PPM family protein phosphatase